MRYDNGEFSALCLETAKAHFNENLIFCINSPAGEDNLKRESCFGLSSRAAYVFIKNADGSVDIKEYLLEKLSSPELIRETDCLEIRAKISGEPVRLCRGFLSDKPDMQEAAGILVDIIERGADPESVKFVHKKSVCPKCGAAISSGSGVCHRCASPSAAAKLLWGYVKPKSAALIASVLLFFVTTGISLIVPVLNKSLIDDYIKSPDPASVTFTAIALMVLSIAAANIAQVAVGIFRNNLLSRVSTATVCDLRRDVYTHIQRMSVFGVTRYSAGDLLSRLSGDTDEIASFLTGQLPSVIEQSLTLFGVGVYLFVTRPVLALFIFVPVFPVIWLYRSVRHYTMRLYRRQWAANSEANTILNDIFRGIRVVKVYGTEKKELEKYDRAVKNVRDVSVKSETVWARIMPYTNFMLSIGGFVVIYAVGKGILNGEMTLGDMTMYAAYVSMIYSPVKFMARLPRMLQRTATSISKVMEVKNDENVLPETENKNITSIKGDISVENVYFGYSPAEPVLKNVSVKVGTGEMLGIVGRSGVGKSTLINLIMRLYDVDSGSIKVDGVDVRDIPQKVLRGSIGVVLQENFLFTGTVYDNIAYACPDAEPSRIIDAAKKASAHSFIMKLPDGYNTQVGENGYTLSGGERQRIAIARAILHDPRILILDEATSSLDTETEKDIQDALKNLIKDRTTVAIAHRLSTLRNATKLLVLDKGRAAEIGTHEQLMKEKGIYYSLVMAQRQMSKGPKEDS